MTDTTVHVFAGKFRDRDDACLYAVRQWEETPRLLQTEEEARLSEERFPTWQMRTDLDVYLDEDFIEVIDDLDGLDRYQYLRSMLRNPDDMEPIRWRAGAEANVLVLIFKDALGGFEARMRSTPRLTYCGEFPCTI